MTRIGTALVGCGAIGRVHAAVASGIAELRITALVDAVPAAADALADRLAAAGLQRPVVLDSLHDALTRDDVELVTLTTPSGFHVSQATEILEGGRHVIIEKPLDVDLARARTIADSAREAAARGLVASVISQHRFDRASRIVSTAVRDGDFGRLTSAIASTAWWRSQSYYDQADWRGTWEMDGGGALINQGVHNVDLLLSIFGTPVEVYGRTSLLAHDRIEVEDSAVATVTFSSGAMAVLHASTSAYPGLATRLHVMGVRGSAVIEDDALTYYHAATGKDPGPMGLGPEGNAVDAVVHSIIDPEPALGFALPAATAGQYTLDPASHQRQYRDIVDAILMGREPTVTVQDAFNALCLIRGVYVSATLGRAVSLEDMAAGRYDDVDVRTALPS